MIGPQVKDVTRMHNMSIIRRFFIFPLVLIITIIGGCGESLYDEDEVYSFHEHIADSSKGGDLLNAMDKAGIKQTILAGSYDASFARQAKPDFLSSQKSNELIMDAMAKAPTRILAFPLIRGDEPELIKYAKELFLAGARGFYLSHGNQRLRPMPLDDDRLQPFYAWCEIHRVPLIVECDYRVYGAELEHVMRDYPNLYIVAKGMLNLTDDLEKLTILLEKFPTLELSLGFGWEEDKWRTVQNLSDNQEAARQFMITYKDRLLFATDLMIYSGAGRNLDWLTQYLLDMRRFLERSSLRYKVLLDGKTTMQKVHGLDLPSDALKMIYNSNYKNIIGEMPSEVNKYNLDRLLGGVPAQAQYDIEADYRLVVAIVTSQANPLDGMVSNWLRNVLSGKTTNWRELAGNDRPIQVVAMPPLDQWLPKRLKIREPIVIKKANTPEEVVRLLQENPGTLAIVPFQALRPEMNVIPVDGESPTGRYVRDCAKRGGGTIGSYFYSYPLLIPLAVKGEIAPELRYDPYEIRHVMISGNFLPQQLPPKSVGLEQEVSSIFKLGGLMRQADLAQVSLGAPLAVNCAPSLEGQGACMNQQMMHALDFAGIDVTDLHGAHLLDQGRGQFMQNLLLYSRHSIDIVGAGADAPAALRPATYRIRMRPYSFLSYSMMENADALAQADSAGLNPYVEATMSAQIRELVAQDHFVFVNLAANGREDDETLRAIAHRAIDDGATIVTFNRPAPPRDLEFYRQGFIAYGLGNQTINESSAAEANISFLARHVFYGRRYISLDLLPLEAHEGYVRPLHATRTRQAYNLLFGGSKRKP